MTQPTKPSTGDSKPCWFQGNHDGLCFNKKHETLPELLATAIVAHEILLNGMQDDYDYMTESLGKLKQAIRKAGGR